MIRYFREHQIELHPVFSTSNYYGALAMVAVEAGVVVTSDSVLQEWEGSVVSVPVSPSRLITEGIACPRECSPALDEFVRFLVNAFQDAD